ncbi:hypothetical protein MJN54_30345, partial [Salmonella enterica subsp. enterica serovar Kentucky]|nr:hypothetical protein [Salmonella enterica subsp. enterica serovar Kentucky]
ARYKFFDLLFPAACLSLTRSQKRHASGYALHHLRNTRRSAGWHENIVNHITNTLLQLAKCTAKA